MSWVEEPGRDYVGNDVQILTGLSYEDCAKACITNAQCWVFTSVNVTDTTNKAGDCFLKNKKGTSIIWRSSRRNSGFISSKGGALDLSHMHDNYFILNI